MSQKLKTIVAVNHYLLNLALSPYDKFYPNSIVNYDKSLDLSNVMSYLLELKEEGIVTLKQERKVDDVMVEVPLNEVDKNKLDEFYPVFYLSEEYKTFVREKHKNLLK